MKRLFFFLLAIFMLFLASCTPSTDVSGDVSTSHVSGEIDDKAPSIRILVTEVTINKGEEYDLLDGVSAKDNVDGNITDKIVIDKGGFDANIAGKYTITYTLKDSAGNEAAPKTRTIIVKETEVMKSPEIWSENIVGEKLDPTPAKVFGGAWYHKVVSSQDKWIGIETIVTLPEFEIETLENEDVQSLLSAIDINDIYDQISLIALFTGMRQSEILGLRWKDVDLEYAEANMPTITKRQDCTYRI